MASITARVSSFKLKNTFSSGSSVSQQNGVRCSAPKSKCVVRGVQRHSVETKASSETSNFIQKAGAGLAALGLAASLSLVPMNQAALAGEFDIINTTPPSAGVVDDAGVLSKATAGDLVNRLRNIEKDSGFKLEVVTVRKLVFEQDPFAFADQVIENWFPTVEEGDKVGVLLLSTSSKEGALVGGPSFMKAIGEPLVEGIVTENIPVFAEQERYNEALLSSVNRIQTVLSGKEDPGGPKRQEGAKGSNFKTKEETTQSRGKFAGVVIGLLVIATAVPMIQYYGYIGGKQ